jgi:hypothetical protein
VWKGAHSQSCQSYVLFIFFISQTCVFLSMQTSYGWDDYVLKEAHSKNIIEKKHRFKGIKDNFHQNLIFVKLKFIH